MPSAERSVLTQGLDRDGKMRDDLGRRQPGRLNMVTLLKSIPGAIEQFSRTVPEDFTAQEVRGGETVTVISCPCGEEPVVPLARLTECECERFYLNIGTRVLVANTPLPAAEPRAESDPPAS